MDTIWKKTLSVLKSEVNEQIFTAWFSPISLVSENNDSITLGVPNKFFETWIKEKYISLIKTALREVSGKSLTIKFSFIVNNEDPDPLSQNNLLGSLPEPSGAVAPSSCSSQKEETQQKQNEKDSSGGWLKSMFGGTRQTPDSFYQKLGLNSNYTFNNFVVGGSNRFAHAASLAVCENLAKAYNPLFLYGGVGLGKTHLMQAIGQEIAGVNNKARILYISSEEFTNQLINAIRSKTTAKFRAMYRNVDILLLDDVQFIAGKESTQEEFFHTFNALHDSHKQIVLCSDRSPQEIPSLEERLVSRFAWGLVADVQPPDFETRIAILDKKSENESVAVPKDVLFFLAEKIRTNIRELEGALIRVVAYAKLTGSELTVSLSKEVLKGMISAEEKKITIDIIQSVVSNFFDIHKTDLLAKKRSRSVAYPRQIAMYISRNLTDYSLPDIGNFFGGRDHTTVLHAYDKISKELEINEKTRNILSKLTTLIKN